ncbi:MAG: hypothetical protein ABJA10_01945 [Aestuariivirga sp.]
MSNSQYWAGKVFGTNVGNVFVELDGNAAQLKGVLRFNDSDAGIVVFEVSGEFSESKLRLDGELKDKTAASAQGKLSVSATLMPDGNLRGLWETTLGAGGTLILFAHSDDRSAEKKEVSADQMYTARHEFGPVELEKDDVVQLAENVQLGFKNSKVVISLVQGTEQSLYLENFKTLAPSKQRPTVLKLYAREPDMGGIDKIVTLEFGPQLNFAMTQGAVEAWALGELEKLKRDVKRFQRFFVTQKYYSVSFNQLLFLGAIIALPSLDNIYKRATLIAVVLVLAALVIKLHDRYLPHASIQLTTRPESKFWKFLSGPAISWAMAIVAATVAALLAAYLGGYFSLAQKLVPPN